MNWTSKKPTVAGWYWFRDLSRPYEDEREPYVVKVRQRGGRLCVGNCDIDGPPYSGEWLGPIAPDSYQQGRVAAFKKAEQRFDSMFGATDRRIDSVRDYRVDKFYTWLAQQAQEGGVGDGKESNVHL